MLVVILFGMIKKLKLSEAKILIFLYNAELRYRYATQIGAKLCIDYIYLNRILKGMVTRRWLGSVKRENKRFYHLLQRAPLDRAIKRLKEK